MKSPVHVAQPAPGHVRVNFRRADVRVTEQLLNHAQIRPVLQQVRREAVPQHVRRDIARHAGSPHATLDAQPKCNRGKRGAARREENVRRGAACDKFGPSDFEVTVQRFDRFPSHGYNTFLVTLADDIDKTRFEMDLLQTQVAEF